MKRLPLGIDPFALFIVGAVVLAAFAPIAGRASEIADHVAVGVVALLFFFQGARLSREAIVAGISHVRLHALIFATTFVVFPLLGLALAPLGRSLVAAELYDGVLMLCATPATIQSAVVFTALARGNVAAAVCSASLSSVLGVLVSPLLLRALGVGDVEVSWQTLADVTLQLVVPLLLGHLARPWLGATVARHRGLFKAYDQGTIVLLVYLAFSDAVVHGLFETLGLRDFAALVVLDLVLLLVVLAFTVTASRRLGFSKEDEVTIVFGGSKKSLASGVAFANVLFPAEVAGRLLLPLMIFHQLQLMASTVLAGRYAARPEAEPPST